MEDQSPVTVLSRWLSSGALKPQVQQWFEGLRNMEDSFYQKVLKDSGRAAAERSLVEIDELRHLTKFASCIEPVAQGILALAQTENGNKGLRVRTFDHNSRIPMVYGFNTGMMIMIRNPEVPGCGCSQPTGAEAFGKYGELGLKAIVLMVGTSSRDSRNCPTACLGLILPGIHGDNGAAFRIAEIRLDGNTNAHTYSPKVDPETYVDSIFGINEKPPVWTGMSSGGGFDNAFGYPGGGDYLAKHIAQLGPYLVSAAAKLSGTHAH